MAMKRWILLLATLLAIACSEIGTDEVETLSSTPLPGRFSGLEYYMDTTQNNQFKADRFCQEWEFFSTQVEVWVDGTLKETRDTDNVCLSRSTSMERWPPRVWREHGIMHTTI